MAIKTPKRTLGTWVPPSPQARLVVISGDPGVVERVKERLTDREIPDTNPYDIKSYLENRASTTTTIARTRGSAQQKYPENRIRSLSQIGYVETASAVKIKTRAVIIPELSTKTPGEKWVMSKTSSAAKMPKSTGRQPWDFDGSF
jgi:hypothetical protein